MTYNFDKRIALRKKLSSKQPWKLYAYIYRANLTKRQILNYIKEYMPYVEYGSIAKESMMNTCCYYKEEVIEAIVGIKYPIQKSIRKYWYC